jgi:hypothetical protein
MKIGVPSGIGDISWLVSKIVNSPEWKNGMEIEVADGWPFRAQPYLDMLNVKSNYGSFKFDDIIMFEKLHPYSTWEDVVKAGFGTYYMQPNWHLEMGRPLTKYLPDLPTTYHYPLTIPSIEDKPYYSQLEEGDYIGISCASYRGAKAWKTWENEQWIDLCERLVADGYKICFLGGSWDDLTRAIACTIDCLNLVGVTSFPEACAVHKLLKFYIGFSSGLGIIRTVMNLPTMMLWPEHQQPLSTSWADPQDLEEMKYIAISYMEPKWIYNVFKQQEKLWR